MGADYRLLVVSSRARNKVAIFNSVLPHLVLVDYNYETTTLDELLQKMPGTLHPLDILSATLCVRLLLALSRADRD